MLISKKELKKGKIMKHSEKIKEIKKSLGIESLQKIKHEFKKLKLEVAEMKRKQADS